MVLEPPLNILMKDIGKILFKLGKHWGKPLKKLENAYT